MTYLLNLEKDTITYKKVDREYQYIRALTDLTGHVPTPEEHESCYSGTFKKVIKVNTGNIELSIGFFEGNVEKVLYIAQGQWGEGIAVSLYSYDWLNRCVWELGMEKIKPITTIDNHIHNLIKTLEEIYDLA